MKKNAFQWTVVCLLIILGLVARLLPHAPNFTPIAAIAIFSAIYLPKKIFLIAPMLVMIISDYLIGFYSLPIMASVYLCFILSAFIGLLIKRYKNVQSIIGGAVGSAFVFYLITNAAVWFFSGLYPNNFYGLVNSYVMALPFFKNTLAGDIFYVVVMVGIMESALFLQQKKPHAQPRLKLLTNHLTSRL